MSSHPPPGMPALLLGYHASDNPFLSASSVSRLFHLSCYSYFFVLFSSLPSTLFAHPCDIHQLVFPCQWLAVFDQFRFISVFNHTYYGLLSQYLLASPLILLIAVVSLFRVYVYLFFRFQITYWFLLSRQREYVFLFAEIMAWFTW